MEKLEVEVLKEHHPLGLVTRQSLGLAEVSKVFVIHEQGDGMGGSLQVMSPVFKSMDDGEQFPIIDVIVSFSRRESLRQVSAGVKIAITVLLHENTPASEKRGVSHDNEGTTDIREVQDRSNLKKRQQSGKHGLLICSPCPGNTLLSQVSERGDDIGEIGNKLLVKVAKT